MGFCGEAVAGIEVHGLGGGLALFAAFGLDGHGRGRDHDQVVDVQQLAGVTHGGSPQPEILRLGVRAQDMLATGM